MSASAPISMDPAQKRPNGSAAELPVLSTGNNKAATDDDGDDAMEGISEETEAAAPSANLDALADDMAEDDDDEVVIPGRSRIRLLPGAEETAASYQIDNEDHTLGNALRWIMTKNPDVELCGYTIPHPSEATLNIRVQTYDTTTAREALEKGLDDLMDLCDTVISTFTAEAAVAKQ